MKKKAQDELKKEIESLKENLEKAKKEAQDNYNKYLYLLAEFENFKKRNAKERAELLKYGHERLLHEILPLIDNLERAMAHCQDTNNLASLVEGLRMSFDDFEKNLKKFGVKEIKTKGEKFNPVFHEALGLKEEKDIEPHTIIAETRKGYLIHERVIRPAQVIVSTKPKEEMKEEKKDQIKEIEKE